MHGYRADIAFDGEKAIPGGALVLVEDGVIIGVEPGRGPAPVGCQVTYGPGTALLPGLMDTHSHLCGNNEPDALDRLPGLSPDQLDAAIEAALTAQLAAGVTTVRDLGDQQWAVARHHRQRPDGPTVVASGPPITSVGGAAGIMVCPTLGHDLSCLAGPPSPAMAALAKRSGVTVEDRLAQVGGLHRGGVTLISGADSGINSVKPHGILPQAVIELAACGVPTTAALASATSLAARACGLADRTGRLRAGLDADLLLVNGDPATDITAIGNVCTVVSRGRAVNPGPGT
jgi:imidazolonepropionase-like amidohydrolase